VKYAIHIDGAFYGPLIKILKPFGDDIDDLIKFGVRTLSLSLYKWFGSNIVSGLALTS
jgi:hypothetical protein